MPAFDPAVARAQLGLGTAAVLTVDADGTLAADSDAAVPTQRAVKTYVDAAAFAGAGYTDEQAQDAFAAAMAAGTQTGLTFSYNDPANSFSFAVTYGSAAGTACQGDDARLSDSRAPSGAAGGGLSGTYPNPAVATNANLTGPVTSVGNATTVADAELAAIAGLVSAADRIPYFTGSGAASLLTRDTDATLAAASDTNVATQKAVKSYVDNLITGLRYKQPARAATTANGTLATAFASGSVIDGVTLATGDRVLLKNQTTGSENGIYTVNASGAPTRATDADSSAELVNATLLISEGTANADTQWTCTNNSPVTVGTTALVFAQITGAGLQSADEATLHLSGSVYSINSTYAGQTSIVTLGTVTSGTWSATTIAVNKGGTGLTALTAHAVYVGNGASAPTALSVGTNGQLLIGQTGADPAFTTLSGSGATFTLSAAGVLTVSAIANASLAGSITAAKLVGTDIATVGTLTAGATGAGFTVALTTSTVTGTLTETHGGTNQSTYALGDVLYAGAANTLSKLAGNTAATRKFLTQTGTGTASAAPAWNALAAGDYPAFVAAGASHAAGGVPDPGATAHAAQPYLLGDDAAFHLPAGKILGTKYVATDQSTLSATAVDLATTDDVTFTLDGTQTVLVMFLSNGYNDTAGKNVSSTCLFDGTEDTTFRNDTGVPGANFGTSATCYGTKSLAAGSHTVKIQHYAPNGGTGHWRARLLVVYLVG